MLIAVGHWTGSRSLLLLHYQHWVLSVSSCCCLCHGDPTASVLQGRPFHALQKMLGWAKSQPWMWAWVTAELATPAAPCTHDTSASSALPRQGVWPTPLPVAAGKGQDQLSHAHSPRPTLLSCPGETWPALQSAAARSGQSHCSHFQGHLYHLSRHLSCVQVTIRSMKGGARSPEGHGR